MKKMILIVVAGCAMLVAVFLMMTSVPSDPKASGIGVKTGVISEITFDRRTKDINMKLDDGVVYYINRGIKDGTDTDSMRRALSGKLVKITFYEPGFDIIALITKEKSRHVYTLEAVVGA